MIEKIVSFKHVHAFSYLSHYFRFTPPIRIPSTFHSDRAQSDGLLVYMKAFQTINPMTNALFGSMHINIANVTYYLTFAALDFNSRIAI